MRFFIFILLSSFSLRAQLSLVKNIDSQHEGKWQFRKRGDANWLSANVPGNIYTDLLQNKIIPDPFISDNDTKIQWLESENWEYTCSFEIVEEDLNKFSHCDILLEGIDTYANVYLNDSVILKTNNAFRTWKKDIRKYLKAGVNKLYFIFESSVTRGKNEAVKIPYILPEGEKIFTRRPQFQSGWDFAPRLVGCGITKSAQLHFWKTVDVKEFHIAQLRVDSSLAKLRASVEIYSYSEEQCQVYLISNNRAVKINLGQSMHLNKGINKAMFDVEIPGPELWWCNGLGDSKLYEFTLRISNEAKETIDIKKNIGLRKIELVQEKDKSGKSFYFKLNGKPVFMKGANFVPPDVFIERTTDCDFPKLAASLNMNMLRVWGGGTYPSDGFYNKCDENGILIWQDMMFACAMYPGDATFLANVKEEVIEQCKRIRDHACLALWCGNNESDEGWKNWEWQKQFKYSANDSLKIWNDYQKLFHELIPSTLKQYDPQTNYWSSSPSIGWGHKESLLEGDSHYWGVWWGKEPFDSYAKKVGRFMSEYGFQSLPAYSTYKKISAEKIISMNSPSVLDHQKNKGGFETMQTYLQRDYPSAKNFKEQIYLSQLLQAKGMQTAIEAHRSAKPYCMGSLFWQFNDCWPAASWSAIDYYGEKKALFYKIKSLFKTTIITIRDQPDSLGIILASDSLFEIKGELKTELLNFQGKILWAKTYPLTIPSNSTYNYSVAKKEFPLFDSTSCYIQSAFWSEGILLCAKKYFFTVPKNLHLTKTTLHINNKGRDEVEVESDSFAKNVYLYSEDGGLDFSDNFFDLKAGERKTIKITGSNIAGKIPELHAIILNNLINLH